MDPVSSTTQRRLIKDIKEIIKNPLTDNGIYYTHDEENMLKGYALIIGPSDSIYEDGFYFFEFFFPKDYPFSPPNVIFHTGDGVTRFNPNIYRNGKTCLSILNTWRGETWTSCQSIRSVLLTLITLFNNKPLLNEPGIKDTHRDFNVYNIMIKYKNFETAICGILTQIRMPHLFLPFFSITKKHFLKKYEKILERIDEEKEKSGEYYVSIYNMRFNIDYKDLKSKIIELYAKLK